MEIFYENQRYMNCYNKYFKLMFNEYALNSAVFYLRCRIARGGHDIAAHLHSPLRLFIGIRR